MNRTKLQIIQESFKRIQSLVSNPHWTAVRKERIDQICSDALKLFEDDVQMKEPIKKET